jgi:hypothetical protein
MNQKASYIIAILFVFIPGFLVAQIHGKILDSESHEPISYAVISWNGGTQGVVSNSNGEFEVVNLELDSLCISAMAYRDTCVALKSFGNNKMLIYLDRQTFVFPEIEVKSSQLTKKEFRVSEKKSTGVGGGNTKYNFIIGTEFTNDQLGTIESVSIFFSDLYNRKKSIQILRLRILSFNEENQPEYDLLTEFVEIKPRRKNRWYTIDLSEYNLRLDKKNFLVGVEYFLNPDMDADNYSVKFQRGWIVGMSEIQKDQRGLIQIWDKWDGIPWGNAPNSPIKNVVPMIKVSAMVLEP